MELDAAVILRLRPRTGGPTLARAEARLAADRRWLLIAGGDPGPRSIRVRPQRRTEGPEQRPSDLARAEAARAQPEARDKLVAARRAAQLARMATAPTDELRLPGECGPSAGSVWRRGQ